MGPDGEIGRRSGLKIRRPQGRGGSSPPPGTNKIKELIENSYSDSERLFRSGGCSDGCWFHLLSLLQNEQVN
jgi:hypothetical protein